MRKYLSAAPVDVSTANISFRVLAFGAVVRIGCVCIAVLSVSDSIRTPVQEDKVCKNIMKQSTEMCDKIMSILVEDVSILMCWGVTKAISVNTDGRVGLVVFVDAFKHRGPVVIYPAEHPRCYDVEVQDYDRHVLKSVACIAAESLVENIDRLVEVTEHYVEDIDRWLIRTPSEIKPYQQLARIMKISPEVAKKVRMKAVMLKG